MNTTKADPRRNPYSLIEKEHLVDLVEKHKHILDPPIRYNDSMTVFKRKQSWMAIENNYNTKFMDNPRDLDQLKRMWSKIKVQIKKYTNVSTSTGDVWNLARTMFHEQLHCIGRKDSQRQDDSNGLMPTMLPPDENITKSAQTEIDVSTSQYSTSQTDMSSDDDLIVMGETNSASGTDQNGMEAYYVEERDRRDLNDGITVPKELVCINHPNENQHPIQVGCPQGVQYVHRADMTSGYETDARNGQINMDSNHLDSNHLDSNHIKQTSPCDDESLISKTAENVADYSAWHSVGLVEPAGSHEEPNENLHNDIYLLNEYQPNDTSGHQSSLGNKRQREVDYVFLNHKKKITQSKRGNFMNYGWKRSGNRLLQRDPERTFKRSHQYTNKIYNKDKQTDEDDQKGEDDFLSESSYRRRMLALAEEEHKEKIRVLHLKCEILELQKQELVNKSSK